MHLRIGTRHSPLALWQAHHVAENLTKLGHQAELIKITTTGDTTTTPLGQGGGVGLFTKEIQRALLDNRCDIAVHSLKDLPTQPIPNLKLSAVPPREVANDCLVSLKHSSLLDLPFGATIGTGSPRRKSQLLHLRPDLNLSEIRGNLDTRIGKLKAGTYDAIILAHAGLHRLSLQTLGLEPHQVSDIPFEIMLPAVGQAALGLETRTDDSATQTALLPLDDPTTHLCVHAERELLRILQAGCLAPVAAHATIANDQLVLRAKVFSIDGSTSVATLVRHSLAPNALSTIAESARISDCRPLENALKIAESLALNAAEKLNHQGADNLIASMRTNPIAHQS